jgi:transcriptional regulator with XRE-family HTH domain
MDVLVKASRAKKTSVVPPATQKRNVAPAATLTRQIGVRLRALRKSQDITLVELSKASGVDAATISRIETGGMTGTLECHLKLATALGVKLTALYEGVEEARMKEGVTVQPVSGRADVYVHESGKYSMAMLTTDILKKKLMPVFMTLEPGGSTRREEAKVGTEKFLYVLEGELEANIGEATHPLKRGGSLYFDASIPHIFRNASHRITRCLLVMTPPFL